MGRPDGRRLGPLRGRGARRRQSRRRQPGPGPLDEGQERAHRVEPDPAGAALVQAVREARTKPRVLIQGSAIGFYGSPGEAEIDESSPSGAGFLAGVVRRVGRIPRGRSRLSASAASSPAPGSCWGGRAGSGRVSPGLSAFSRAGRSAAGDSGSPGSLSRTRSGRSASSSSGGSAGPFDLTAPQPLRQKELCRIIGRALRRPCWLPVPAASAKAPFRREGRGDAARQPASLSPPARRGGLRVPPPRRCLGRGGPGQIRTSRGISRRLKFEAMLRQ